jgi:D-alanine-D-alanine ligase
MAKLRVGLLFGGRSVEHEVSIASATSILGSLDPSRYEVRLIGVDRDGHWRVSGSEIPPELTIQRGAEVIPPWLPGQRALETLPPAQSSEGDGFGVDVIFPIIHGSFGEDGTLQGLLECAGIPYVGSRVLGSAVQMDKDVAKRLLAAAGLPVVPWVTLRGNDLLGSTPSARSAIERFGLPLFVKPANSGSSVGTSKVVRAEDLEPAIHEAARYDTKVLIEQAVDAREVEVAVIGNEAPRASVPGEIRQGHDFYDYAAKYADDETELVIPARLDTALSERIQTLALEAYQSLEGEGFARVDFLLGRHDGALYINELNSLPGFTEASMFPLMWEASGLPYPALLDHLIELAFERDAVRRRLELTYRRG